MRKCILIVAAISALAIFSVTSTFANGKESNVIFVDMSFDNHKLRLPAQSKDTVEKLTTLIVSGLEDNLSKRGNKTYVTGKSGVLKDLVERLDEAQERRSALYISISISSNTTNKDCINIRYPIFKRRAFSRSGEKDERIPDEIFNTVGNAARESVTNESKTLANMMTQYLHDDPPKCSIANAGDDYLLQITSIPTLIIEFQLLDITKSPSYLTSKPISKISYDISEAINKFLSYPVGSFERTGVR